MPNRFRLGKGDTISLLCTAEIPKGPRTLDIDILFFGNRHIEQDSPALTIPHPAVRQRAFALIPLLELYPHYIDPVTQQPLAAALAALPDQGVRKSPAQIEPVRE